MALTKKQIESLGGMAGSSIKSPQGLAAGAGVVGYPKPVVQTTTPQVLGYGSQAAPPSDPSDPLNWKGIAAAMKAGTAAASSPVDYGQVANTDPFGLISAAKNAGNRTLGDVFGQQNNAEDTAALDYGANPLHRNAQGQVDQAPTWLTNLASNPFSKAALLQTSYQHQGNRTTNNYASAGQLYSGAILNQRAADTSAYDQGNDALLKALTGIITGAEGTKSTTATNVQNSIDNAGAQTLSQLTGLSPDQLVAMGLIKTGGAAAGGAAPPAAPASSATGQAAGAGAVNTDPFQSSPSEFPKPGTALPTGGVVPKPKVSVGKKVSSGYSVPKGGFGRS